MFVQIGDKPILKGTRLNECLTRQVRKFIIENAHRKVFSNNFDSEVLLIRPRVIDPDAVKKEKNQMKEWHDRNIKLELEYL